MVKLTDKYRTEVALFRYGILAPLISGTWEGTSDSQFFKEAASKTYILPNGKEKNYTPHTIYRWYLAYSKDGFDALKIKNRGDNGKFRRIDDDIADQIIYMKKEYPRLPATLIKQKLIENGTINDDDLSLSTITRFINRHCEKTSITQTREMKRYEREHINEVWCGDSSVGPYIKEGGTKRRVYIIALIDDASRFIVGIDVFYNDNFVNLMKVIKSAVTKYGKPKIFNFDNGANYKSHQMKLLAARIGTTINYCAPRTPTSKAKIERWFRTLKDQWMAGINYNDYHSLDELRVSLMKYVQEYNNTVHSALNGSTPQDRFFNESSLIIRIEDSQIEKAFLLEIERKVSADCIVMIDSQEYEVDSKYANRRITIRYSSNLDEVYAYDKESDTYEKIHLVDKHENSKIKRKVKMVGNE